MDLVRILRGGEEPPGVDSDAGAGTARGVASAPPLTAGAPLSPLEGGRGVGDMRGDQTLEGGRTT